MKAVLLVLAFVLSLGASSYAAPEASLKIGKKTMTLNNIRTGSGKPSQTISADMYSFEDNRNAEMCFNGNPKSVEKIIVKMLGIGTGDSEVTGHEIKISKNLIKLTFDWNDEGGDHQTSREIRTCESSPQASADISINCVATKITGGPLDESFSVEEYSGVSVTETEASIGANGYSTDDEDSIEMSETSGYVKAMIIAASGEESFELIINKKSGTGQLIYHTTNEEETEPMADLVCK